MHMLLLRYMYLLLLRYMHLLLLRYMHLLLRCIDLLLLCRILGSELLLLNIHICRLSCKRWLLEHVLRVHRRHYY